MIVTTVRRATWLSLPLLAALGRVSPVSARAVTFVLAATVGVAHGANDDLILARLLPGVPGGRNSISLAYAAGALGVFVLAQRAPLGAARVLSLLSAFHFGSGDVAFGRACAPANAYPQVDALVALDAAVRGTIPLAIDSERRPAALLAIAYAALPAFRGKRADALDIAVLAATLAFSPPSLGFAGYFAAWHAPRHLALVLESDSRGGSPLVRLRAFAREASRNTLLALMLGALAFALTRGRRTTRSTATALILGLTVPHQLAVTYAQCHPSFSRRRTGTSGRTRTASGPGGLI